MADDILRNRLAMATADHYLDAVGTSLRCSCGSWNDSLMPATWDDHLADISVAVFVTWLREKGEAVAWFISAAPAQLFYDAAADIEAGNA